MTDALNKLAYLLVEAQWAASETALEGLECDALTDLREALAALCDDRRAQYSSGLMADIYRAADDLEIEGEDAELRATAPYGSEVL